MHIHPQTGHKFVSQATWKRLSSRASKLHGVLQARQDTLRCSLPFLERGVHADSVAAAMTDLQDQSGTSISFCSFSVAKAYVRAEVSGTLQF